METIKVIQIRIHFRNFVKMHMVKYEGNLMYKYRNNNNLVQNKISKMNQNYINYKLFDYLSQHQYSKVLEVYSNEIFQSKDQSIKGDDNTKIILLFLPHLLKSNKIMLSQEQISLPHFQPNNLKISDLNLKNLIKDFFENYSKMNIKGFMFHRREMLVYMETFLYMNTEKEENSLSELCFNNLDCFRIFLRPELRFLSPQEIEEIS
jgi:hypothetical protein